LRADPVLRRRYAALKRAIVAGGPADPVAFTKAKHHWIAATLTNLGLAGDQPRRLYQDDLDQDNCWPCTYRSGTRRPDPFQAPCTSGDDALSALGKVNP
jgi:hypothetical protein